jgi:hypothetical protein
LLSDELLSKPVENRLPLATEYWTVIPPREVAARVENLNGDSRGSRVQTAEAPFGVGESQVERALDVVVREHRAPPRNENISGPSAVVQRSEEFLELRANVMSDVVLIEAGTVNAHEAQPSGEDVEKGTPFSVPDFKFVLWLFTITRERPLRIRF